MDEAIACYQKAIALDPKYAMAHNNLGNALAGKGQLDEAIACYRKAIDLDPKDAKAHYNLGVALQGKGQVDEAIACCRKAIALDPKHAGAHSNLGIALAGKGQLDEAIACYQKAIASTRRTPRPTTNLGIALAGKGQLDEAIACFQKAIALDPKHANAPRCAGPGPVGQGTLRRGPRCLGPRPRAAARTSMPLRAPVLRQVQRMRTVPETGSTAAAPASRGGETRLGPGMPGPRHRVPAQTAARRRRPLLRPAFAADPNLADDPGSRHRYNAACSAALAAAGQGEDAAKLDDKRTRRSCASRPSTGSRPTWPLGKAPRIRPAPGPTDHREGRGPLAEGQRPGRHPRRGGDGQAPGGRTAGVYPVVGRRGGAAEKSREAEIGVGPASGVGPVRLGKPDLLQIRARSPCERKD